jgi:hypothetical protein
MPTFRVADLSCPIPDWERNMRGTVLRAAILAFAAALNADGASAAAALNPRWSTILPPVKARLLLKQCSRDAPQSVDATWTPRRTEIAELESRLGPILAERLDAIELSDGLPDRPAPADYYRQYAGIIIAGRRVIYVNGFSKLFLRDFGTEWHREPVRVCDGGEELFGVEYDPATKTFANFRFNGRI